MGPLTARIARLEYTVKELLGELDEIKKMARTLQQENEKLRNELAESYMTQVDERDVHRNNEEPSLLRLYDEGFHVCNLKFAQPREEECLFCMGLMRRQEIKGVNGK